MKLMEFLYLDQTDAGGRRPTCTSCRRCALRGASRSSTGPTLFLRPADHAALLGSRGDVPADYANPFIPKAQEKRDSAFVAAGAYYSEHGEDGFVEFVRAELKRQADDVRAVIARNQITDQ